jgi:hypothetical protein
MPAFTLGLHALCQTTLVGCAGVHKTVTSFLYLLHLSTSTERSSHFSSDIVFTYRPIELIAYRLLGCNVTRLSRLRFSLPLGLSSLDTCCLVVQPRALQHATSMQSCRRKIRPPTSNLGMRASSTPQCSTSQFLAVLPSHGLTVVAEYDIFRHAVL